MGEHYFSIICFGFGFALAFAIASRRFTRARARAEERLSQRLTRLTQELNTLWSRYDLLTNNVTAAICIWDPTESISYCNKYIEVLTGYPAAEVQAHPEILRRVIPSLHSERYQRAWQIALLGEDIVVRYEIQHRSGVQLWVETHFVPVMNDLGDLVHVLSVTVDITASVQHQTRIQEHNRDLGDFAYMVSHDLKAPIFTVRGMASTLLEDFSETLQPEAIQSIEFIFEAAGRLEQLVASVIEYSAISTKDVEEAAVSLDATLRDVIRDQSAMIEVKQAEIQVAPNLPIVKGEPVRIYQVFSNLLSNALKFHTPERPIRVSVTREDLGTQYVRINFSDNGTGIPESRWESIFRPYHRVQGREREGSGIGLACVKKIVERLGGSVSVMSRPGEGTTFSLVLPLAREAPHSQFVHYEAAEDHRFDA